MSLQALRLSQWAEFSSDSLPTDADKFEVKRLYYQILD